MRWTRRRAVGVIAAVVAIPALWIPSLIARSYTTPAQPIELLTRPDNGWRFLYDAARTSRHARLGTEGAALDRAKRNWRRADAVELVYLVRPVTIPAPDAGPAVSVPARTVRPRSRFSWFVYGRVGSRPRQVIGVLDYRTGRVVWDLRRVEDAR